MDGEPGAAGPPGEARALFAFRFDKPGLDGRATVSAVASLDEIGPSSRAPDAFIWVHLDLDDPASRAWILALPVPADILAIVADPIARGRLFALHDTIYGQLRDLRASENDAAHGVEAATLSLLVRPGLVVTGRRTRLLAVERLRAAVEAGATLIDTPIALLTAFFTCLNDIGEDLLDQGTERISTIEAEVLRTGDLEQRSEVLKMRRESLRLLREMAYKRTSMLDLLRECPPLAEPGEYRELCNQLERYNAQIEDLHDFADRCQFLLDEQRAQIAENTNRNLYVLTIFSVMFMPAMLIAAMWGMNVEWLPFGTGENGFWELSTLMAGSFGVILMILRWLRFF